MSHATENLEAALERAIEIRPKVGGFPYLAETLRRAGVTRNQWLLPACQSIYHTQQGPVVSMGTPLTSGMSDIPSFDRDALIRALRADQGGHTTFPEFIEAAWRAGVIRWEVDLSARTVTYHGWLGENYVEEYRAVEL
jgi:uncharacterized protein YbcV (DUF1398 family)